jgi:predicted ArsR family transcriptional regulator
MKTKNEEKAILKILQSPEKEYNANSISKLIKITSMGALKLLKRLEKEGILELRKVSNISFYRVNF